MTMPGIKVYYLSSRVLGRNAFGDLSCYDKSDCKLGTSVKHDNIGVKASPLRSTHIMLATVPGEDVLRRIVIGHWNRILE